MHTKARDIVGSMRRLWRERRPVAVALILLVIGVPIVIAAAIASDGVFWQHQKDGKQVAASAAAVKEAKKAQDLTLKRDYDEAHATITKALADPNLSAEAKHALLAQEGIIYENQKNFTAAMESYRKAESFGESLQVVQSIAHIAADKGDKELAITYYKKAITLLPKENPRLRDNLKRYFENMILYLEGGQPKDE